MWSSLIPLGARDILEVLIVTIGSDSTLELGWTGPGSTRSCERGGRKRNHSAVQRLLIEFLHFPSLVSANTPSLKANPQLCTSLNLLIEAGNNIIFTPVVVSACGAMGPSMVAFLKVAYGRAKEADKFLMSQQQTLKHTWNMMVASSFWDMHLRIACAANDAEYQNRILLRDNTLNLPVVARQPHRDPNHEAYTAARHVITALITKSGASGFRIRLCPPSP